MRALKQMVLTMAAAAAVATTSLAGNIGVIDMEQLIKLHPRTATDRAILEGYVKEFEDERADLVDQIKKEGAELQKLSKEAEDVGLSEKALEEKRALAKAKIMKIRQLQRKARELADERQKNLTSQELQMRKRVVNDIRKIVERIAKEKKLDMVLDNTGVGIGGYNPVIYNDRALDITDDVIKKMPQSDSGK
jgi:Skp family chaperone for outer membrane proteins